MLAVARTYPCQCGAVFPNCVSDTHMEILETMVHCAEMLKDYVQAISASSIMVFINPISPAVSQVPGLLYAANRHRLPEIEVPDIRE